jgi:hypothetical protein
MLNSIKSLFSKGDLLPPSCFGESWQLHKVIERIDIQINFIGHFYGQDNKLK